MASPKSPTRWAGPWLCAALLGLSGAAAAEEAPSPAPLVPITAPASTAATTPPDEAPPQTAEAPDSDPCLADPQCDALYEQARTAFKEARYQDAFDRYQDAYKRRQMPWLLLNSGRALQRLGQLDEALDLYDRYKRSDVKPTPERLAKANQYIAEVKVAREEAAQRSAGLTAAPHSAPEAQPVYKKWWFWTVLGGVAVGAVATGLAVGLTRSHTTMTAMQPTVPSGVTVYQPMF